MRAKRRKKKKWLRWVGGIVAVLLIGIGAYAYSIYHHVKQTANQMYENVDWKSDKRDDEVSFKEKTPISILLIGVDERKGDRGRADSLIVMTVNPNKKSIEMVSVPRDTRTKIIGKGSEDKINHSYAFGGVEMTMATVEHFLDIPIDYYIKVNMESFRDIVDAVGGVTVDNPFAFTYEGVTFPKGKITLDGEKALKYSRMRYEDPRGDFGRQDRQKQIIQAIIEKGASFSSLANYNDVLAAIGKNIKTNLTFEEMKEIQSNYKDARHHIEQLHITGKGTKINGIYYLLVPEEERLAISNKLKEHLELKTAS
ncbi:MULTISPECIES: LytR family transcriptional regulator [unclassified Geobacillus]|uniref:polyisoprenyl-teichoic acid--peptidoglycan teichoic acid transferase TagU n=1 Tax=unclassified Geobacillus TaxID=2642459 RepID=UPI000BE33AB5|nr:MULTISPECIES: LytR family transcriptional regulator [unclassified Geobacillus]PDM39612.1 LytR family transcriptional regulator [Parageobacillus yumthangensis]RDV22723.1 LytR family transcriptional regulator [Parageobacillus toebii]TXK91144.1 LytR family transcriptional regulator [Parageobacillus sp. SY1]PUF88199.1 LytR family transcriptional regulator [Geobacillus sp. LYN3]TXK88952.1 LytR family transcriptional regulator [Geobacillus sp. AYS3]